MTVHADLPDAERISDERLDELMELAQSESEDGCLTLDDRDMGRVTGCLRELKALRKRCERMRIALERIREEGDDHSDAIAWECLSGSSPDAPVSAEPTGEQS